MWKARRIYLKDEGLSDNEKHQLMDLALRNIVFHFVEALLEENVLLGWYCSRRWDESDGGIQDSSVRIYVHVEDDIELYVENNFYDLLNSNSLTIAEIEPESVDEKLVTLPFIQKACEAARSIMYKYPEWSRRRNKNCYDEVVAATADLKDSMEGFTEAQKAQVGHFVLQNALFIEAPYGTPASWEVNGEN